MNLRNVALAVCILLTALCGGAFAEDQPANANYNDCLTLCTMDTTKITINNPYPGLNVTLTGPRWSYYNNTIHPALSRLGYQKTACGGGGCTYVVSSPVDCSKAMRDAGRCNFPNNNGVLKSGRSCLQYQLGLLGGCGELGA